MKSAILMIACSLAAAAETVILNPVKDSDIYSFTDSATGSIYTLGINSSGVGSPHSQRSLIQFNLTGLEIPAAEIGTAKLRVYVVAPDTSFGALLPGNVQVSRQTAAWTITKPSLKWNNFQAADPSSLLAVPAGSSDSWVEVDVTPLVVSWVSGSNPNYGFALQAQSETTPINVTFASMELAGVGPQLRITRAEAPTSPPVLSLTTSSSSLVLRWPVGGSAGWVLQGAESPDGPWTPIDGAVQSSLNWEFSATPSVSGRGFFRLSKP